MPIEIKNRTKLIIIYSSGIANPNQKEVVLHFCWNAFYRKGKHWARCGEKHPSPSCQSSSFTGSHQQYNSSVGALLKKLKPSNQTPGYRSKGNYTFPPMFIKVLFTVARYSSKDGWGLYT